MYPNIINKLKKLKMATKPKTKLPKPVKPKETIASLKAERKEYNKAVDSAIDDALSLHKENRSLKNSFDMLKANFEREKNRLDKVIDSLLNVTKAK